MKECLAPPCPMTKVMVSLNRNEAGDTAQKTWALMFLFQLKKWVCSDPGPHSTMSAWRLSVLLRNLLPQHLSQ